MATLMAVRAELGNPAALSSWSPTGNPCSYTVDVTCDTNGLITRLNVGGMNSMPFGSTVPASVSQLTGLQMLHLSFNTGMGGTLPPQYSLLTNLRELYVGVSGSVSGTLPPQYSTLTELSIVSFRNNVITGTLPPEWSALTKLTWTRCEAALSHCASELQLGAIPHDI
jgi:hypothetical protein